ncbi:hypothetical protein DAMA08_008660 [Martiniozyma asiatica (nom. inval.)]|nr:hypothetical protein DAMA08_008660 [Martiniozyma asiatica]
MARSTCDGDTYVHSLAVFIRSHERQLANAVEQYRKQAQLNKPVINEQDQSQTQGGQKEDNSYDDSLAKEITKPIRLSISPHHLYFILGKFQELGINVGPMNLRLDTIDSENASNYVSFLSEFQHSRKIPSDTQSIHSISSVKSVMSSVSALWNTLSVNTIKGDNIAQDLKYIFSAFTKLPCLRLAVEPNAKLIEGHEEYPFETATPIKVFKNLVFFEISELDPKDIYGWDFLAENLRHLTIKKTNIYDPLEVLIELVEADENVRGTTNHEESAQLSGAASSSSSPSNNHASLNTGGLGAIGGSFPSSYPSSALQTASHSNVSLASAATSSTASLNNLNKKTTSPPMNSASQFYSHYHHNHHHHHNYHNGYHHHNHSINIDPSSSHSISTSPNYYPNRLYVDDIIQNNVAPTLSSSMSRRSYHYYQKPKSRRSRGSTCLSIDQKPNLHAVDDDLDLNKPSANVSSSITTSTNNIDEKNDELNAKYWKFLKRLSLAENKIERISDNSFNNLSSLILLDLSHNNLTVFPEKALSKLNKLKYLNLSYNRLISTAFPTSLNKLTTLNLKGNRISDLSTVERLTQLSTIDLRYNRINKVSNLKPLLIINKSDSKVLVKSLLLTGNPISKSRGYRIELFNLFNGVDYGNHVKIDGSRPGIFESRLLLDEKTAKLKFINFMDESIISKMTASVSNMNLNGIVKRTVRTTATTSTGQTTTTTTTTSTTTTTTTTATTTTPTPRSSLPSHKAISPPISNKSKTTADGLSPKDSLMNSSFSTGKLSMNIISNGKLNDDAKINEPIGNVKTEVNGINEGIHTSIGEFAIPKITSRASSMTTPIQSRRGSVGLKAPISGLLPPVYMSTTTTSTSSSSPVDEKRATSGINTPNSIGTLSRRTSQETSVLPGVNPIQRLSLASPALPVITQAVTTTTTTTTANNTTTENKEKSHNGTGTETETEIAGLNINREEKGELTPQQNINVTVDGEASEFSNGLKISVS